MRHVHHTTEYVHHAKEIYVTHNQSENIFTRISGYLHDIMQLKLAGTTFSLVLVIIIGTVILGIVIPTVTRMLVCAGSSGGYRYQDGESGEWGSVLPAATCIVVIFAGMALFEKSAITDFLVPALNHLTSVV